MSTTLALAVGLDSTLLLNKNDWRSAGFLLVSASEIGEAVELFRTGDFDLVLLGPGLTLTEKQRLTSLIRVSGSRSPVVCITDSTGEGYSFANATFSSDPDLLIPSLGKFMARFVTKYVPRLRDLSHVF